MNQARHIHTQCAGKLRRLLRNALRYDTLEPTYATGPAYASARTLVLTLIALFIFLGVLLSGLELIDNKATTASTGLIAAHRSVSMDWGGWFTEGVWWTGKQTPTPLPFTLHGLFFSLFGYSVRGILMLHTLVGAVSAWLLFRITTRRFGPWSGLLGAGLCVSMPLFLYVTLAGWTFVWATMFLLLAIELTDRTALTRRGRWFMLAGLALGCAGMSRPENYAAAAVFVAITPVRFLFRIAFLALAFAYPVTQSLLNTLVFDVEPGLRILEDARLGMSYWTLFHEWFRSVRYVVLDRNYSTLLQWCILPAVVCLGLPRHRLLTGILAYFWIAFFTAYAMRRLSFNHEGYYYTHVVLSTPFLAAGLMWLTGPFRNGWKTYGVGPRRASVLAVVLLMLLVVYDRASLRRSYGSHLFFRIPEPARELRDFLADLVEPGEPLILDYFREVSWMLAELERDQGSNIFHYNVSVSGEPRPRLNAARKGVPDAETDVMNRWVFKNLNVWQSHNRARYVVLLTSEAWERETGHATAMSHYPMFGLRAVLRGEDTGALLAGITSHNACNGILFANRDFLVYDLHQDVASTPFLGASFDSWKETSATPEGWTAFPVDGVRRTTVDDQDTAATLLPMEVGTTRLRYAAPVHHAGFLPGTAICIETAIRTVEREALQIAVHFEQTLGERYTMGWNAADTGGLWARVHRVCILPEGIAPGTMTIAVVLGPDAGKPASVSDFIIRPAYLP